jgi:hypothetical protein
VTVVLSRLALAGVAFLLFGFGVVWCAIRMVRSNRNDILAAAPVVPAQELRLPSSGMARVMLECPRTSAEYSNMRIELVEKETGRSVTADYSPIAAQGAVYGVTTMQVPIGPSVMLRTGAYVVRIGGLQAGNDYSRYRLMISRPYIGRLTLQIIGLVLCGVAMLLDVIWVCWMAGWMQSAATHGPARKISPSIHAAALGIPWHQSAHKFAKQFNKTEEL